MDFVLNWILNWIIFRPDSIKKWIFKTYRLGLLRHRGSLIFELLDHLLLNNILTYLRWGVVFSRTFLLTPCNIFSRRGSNIHFLYHDSKYSKHLCFYTRCPFHQPLLIVTNYFQSSWHLANQNGVVRPRKWLNWCSTWPLNASWSS